MCKTSKALRAGGLVHSPSEGNAAESRLVDLFARAIREVDADRDDVNPATLAAFAVRALGTAAEVPASEVAPVARLVLHALRRLHPPPRTPSSASAP